MVNGIAFHGGLAKRDVMKRLALLPILFVFTLGACERHDFEGPEGTKRLHEHHGSHGEEHEGHDEKGH